MTRLRVFALATVLAAISCDEKSSKSSAAASLDEICVELTGAFRIPSDPNGPPQGNQNSEPELFRRLANSDVRERAEAAKKLLRHSERRVPATLDAAIRVSGSLGDYRVLNNLEKVATQWASAEDPDATRVAYPLSSRVAAAAAIGRILELDRSSPPGHDEAGQGISDDSEQLAIAALKLSACPGEPTELRSAAIEALGIARNNSASHFLDLTFAEPQAPDDTRNLFIQVLAARSLTNIQHNNHLIDSDVDEKLRELLTVIESQTTEQP